MDKVKKIIWIGVGVFVCIALGLLFGWLILMKKKDPIAILRRTYGTITNPAKEADASRASALRDAISVVWDEANK